MYGYLLRHQGVYRETLQQYGKDRVGRPIQQRIFDILADGSQPITRRQAAFGFFLARAANIICPEVARLAQKHPEIMLGEGFEMGVLEKLGNILRRYDQARIGSTSLKEEDPSIDQPTGISRLQFEKEIKAISEELERLGICLNPIHPSLAAYAKSIGFPLEGKEGTPGLEEEIRNYHRAELAEMRLVSRDYGQFWADLELARIALDVDRFCQVFFQKAQRVINAAYLIDEYLRQIGLYEKNNGVRIAREDPTNILLGLSRQLGENAIERTAAIEVLIQSGLPVTPSVIIELQKQLIRLAPVILSKRIQQIRVMMSESSIQRLIAQLNRHKAFMQKHSLTPEAYVKRFDVDSLPRIEAEDQEKDGEDDIAARIKDLVKAVERAVKPDFVEAFEGINFQLELDRFILDALAQYFAYLPEVISSKKLPIVSTGSI